MLRGVRCAHDAKQLSPRAETTASLIRDWYRRHMPHDGAADDNWFELPTLGLRFWFALWPLLVQSMLAVSGLMYLLLTSKVVKGASEAWSLRSAARAFACVVLLPAIVIITPFSSLVFDLFVVEILVIPFENLSNEGYFIFKDIGKDSKEQATRLGAFHQVILVARRAMLAFFAFFGSEWLRMETPTLPFSSFEWRLMLGVLCVADFFCSIRVLNLMSLRPTEKPFRGGLSYFDIFTAMQAISKLDHQQFCHQRVLPKGGTNKGTARTAVQTLVQTLYNCLFAKKKKTEKGGEEKQEKQEKQKLVLSSPGLPGRAEKREDAVKELGIPEYSEAFDMLEAVEDHAMHDREGFIVKQSENSEEKSKTTREQLLTVTLDLLNKLKEISKQGEGGKKKLKRIVKKIEEYEPWGSGEPGATLARELGELNKEDEVTKLDGGSNGTLTIQTAAGQTVELGPNTKNEVTQKVTQNTTIRRIQEILAENHMKNLPKKEKKKTLSGKQWTEADSVVILNPKRCPKRPSDASKQGEQSADESTPLADPKCSRKVTLPNYLTPDEYEEEDINMSKNNGSYTLADFGILDDEMGDHVLHAWYDHPMRALPLKNGLDFELWGNSDLNEGDAKDADEKERKRKKQAKEEMQKGHWERGETVKKCTYFVSHAWNDEKLFPKKKVRMLRGFLCLQQLLVRWTIAFPLMALFFVPLGFAIDAIIRDAVRNMVEYDLAHGGDGSGVAIAGLIDIFLYVPWASVMIIYFLLLIWLVAASNDSLPDSGDRRIFGRRWRIPPPWALYSSTLWLDKTCVRQNTTETVASGTKSFARFLPQCDQMIAFLGPSCKLCTCNHPSAAPPHLTSPGLCPRLCRFLAAVVRLRAGHLLP